MHGYLGQFILGKGVLARDEADSQILTVDASVTLSATPTASVTAIMSAGASLTLTASASCEFAGDKFGDATVTLSATLTASAVKEIFCSADVTLSAFLASGGPLDTDDLVMLDVDVFAESGEHIDADAEETLDVIVTAECFKVMNASITVPVIINTAIMDPVTEEVTYDETGIDLIATAGFQHTETFLIPLSPALAAKAYITKASAIDVDANVTLSVSLSAGGAETGDATVEADFILTATAEVSSDNAALQVDFTVSADCSLVTSASATVNTGFDVSFSAVLLTNCITSEYMPQIGGTSGDVPAAELPEDSGETGFQLQWPVVSPSDFIFLPNPSFNNPHRFNMDRINRETRGGTLIIFADPIWPKITQLSFSFSNLDEDTAYDMRRFLREHLGDEIRIIDHENRAWRGIVVQPGDPLVQDGTGCQYTYSFTFEGERM